MWDIELLNIHFYRLYLLYLKYIKNSNLNVPSVIFQRFHELFAEFEDTIINHRTNNNNDNGNDNINNANDSRNIIVVKQVITNFSLTDKEMQIREIYATFEKASKEVFHLLRGSFARFMNTHAFQKIKAKILHGGGISVGGQNSVKK